jgi:hypothetical protein
MALQLPLTDAFQNEYPKGYRRVQFFAADKTTKSIRVVFNNYPSAEFADANPDRFLSQTEYRIGPNPVPATLSYDGRGTLDAAALATMGVTVNKDGQGNVTGLVSDPSKALDATALSGMGVTITKPRVPSYDEYISADAAQPSGTIAQIYAFAKEQPENQGATDV